MVAVAAPNDLATGVPHLTPIPFGPWLVLKLLEVAAKQAHRAIMAHRSGTGDTILLRVTPTIRSARVRFRVTSVDFGGKARTDFFVTVGTRLDFWGWWGRDMDGAALLSSLD